MSYFQVLIENLNETFVRIRTNNEALYEELYERFSFEVPGARFMPSYKEGKWDGWIHLFSLRDRTIYKGLLKEVLSLLKDGDYGTVRFDGFKKLEDLSDQMENHIAGLGVPDRFETREYQVEAAIAGVSKRRLLIESPTSSGKSLMVYYAASFVRNLLEEREKILIVVPTVMLVDQYYEDFRDYGCNFDIHRIAGGPKVSDADVYVSTWQSLQKQPASYFKQFRMLIVDEVHGATASVLKGICEKCTNASYKLGFTGTLKDTVTDIMVLRGLFGQVHVATTIRELIDAGQIADPTIRMVRVSYGEEFRDLLETCKKDFEAEEQNVLSISQRDEVITDIIEEERGQNGIVLFKYNRHGKRLIKAFKKRFPKRKCFLINGEISREVRAEIRRTIDSCTSDDERGVILFATYKTMSTGVSIRNS